MIAMFGQHTLLAERAAFNGIDISRYMRYPPETIKRILQALENGCSKRKIDQLVENSESLIRYLDSHTKNDDIRDFTDDLLGSTLLPQKVPDIRSQIRKWDLILPEDSYLGWSSGSIPFTRDRIQKYVDKNEPEPGKSIPLFMWADSLLNDQTNNTILPGNEEDNSTESESAEYYGIRTAEYLSCYMTLSGLPLEVTVGLCGNTAAAMGLDNAEIYQCMLEAASIAIAVTDGVWAGRSYYDSHKSRIRYKIYETGFLKKKLIVEEITEKGKLFLHLSEAIKQKENSFDTLLQAGAGHNELVLWHSVMEYAESKKISQGIDVDREKQQYAKELFRFLESRRLSCVN